MQMQMRTQTQTQTQTQMQTQTQTQILRLFSHPQREGNHLQYSQNQGRIQCRVLRRNSLMDRMTLAVGETFASHPGVSLELAP